MPERTEECRPPRIRQPLAESQEVLPETSPVVRTVQGGRPAGTGDRCGSHQTASRRPEAVLGRKELAAPLQELP